MLTLESAPKRHPDEFRAKDIDDYRLPVEAFANPVCGSLGPAVASDLSSPTTSATFGAFNTRSGDYLRETMWGGHADSYRDSVRIGVLEGMERYAGIRARGKRTVVVDSLANLGGEALDPRDCGVYSDEFYRSNPHIRPFSPDRAIPWVWGYSMRRPATGACPRGARLLPRARTRRPIRPGERPTGPPPAAPWRRQSISA